MTSAFRKPSGELAALPPPAGSYAPEAVNNRARVHIFL